MRYLFVTFFWFLSIGLACAEDNHHFSKKLFDRYAGQYQPQTTEKLDQDWVDLGKKIFFDTRFSTNKKMACGTCHLPDQAFSDQHTTAIGNDGKALLRKTMTLYHIADDDFYFWDGRSQSLMHQFSEALKNPLEMDFSFPKAIALMQQDQDYQKLFDKIKQPISEKAITNAVVTYVKSIKPPHTRFDSWLEGNLTALTEQELKGFDLFNTKANCIACHMGYQFKDGLLNDIGLPDKDLGHGEITKNPDDYHMFKTPSLRGVALHAPYMHNGSLKTLKEVIEHYNAPEFKRGETDIPPPEEQDDEIAFHNFTQPLNLTEEEQEALIAFLKTL